MLINLIIAFGAGLISFLSPCVLPLIPGYISYISGESLDDIIQKKKKILLKTILFSLGFSIVFVSFGATSSFIGSILLEYSNPLRIFAGITIIIFSLQLMGILNLNFLNREKRVHTKNYSNNFFFPILVGAAFGFGWTPCIGPVLGSILALAATESSVGKGILLLSFYSLGLAIPFVLSGYGVSKLLEFSKNFKKNIHRIYIFGGIILFITGVLILTNKLQTIGYFLLEALPFLGNIG
tara:strand:+ start:1959 stop:2672 length:714 start_codon:yes stop_codon:yes gene_type:complete